MSDRHQQKPYPLRMPEDLRAALEKAAANGNRSLHAEIVSRLQASVAPEAAGLMVQPLALRELEQLFAQERERILEEFRATLEEVSGTALARKRSGVAAAREAAPAAKRKGRP